MLRLTKVFIFDLDDTLHDASAHIFPVMNHGMTQYIQKYLNLEEAAAFELRQRYWQIYGATLKGLMRHHGIDPYHFLEETHRFIQLPTMVIQTKRLRHMLQTLPGRKVIFTNAPKRYAIRILDLLGIGDLFECIFSVESAQFHAKPSVRGFQMLLRKIKIKPSQCTMLEDSLPALMTAKRLGMQTVWVSRSLQKPCFVDYRLDSVLALTHLKL